MGGGEEFAGLGKVEGGGAKCKLTGFASEYEVVFCGRKF